MYSWLHTQRCMTSADDNHEAQYKHDRIKIAVFNWWTKPHSCCKRRSSLLPLWQLFAMPKSWTPVIGSHHHVAATLVKRAGLRVGSHCLNPCIPVRHGPCFNHTHELACNAQLAVRGSHRQAPHRTPWVLVAGILPLQAGPGLHPHAPNHLAIC